MNATGQARGIRPERGVEAANLRFQEGYSKGEEWALYEAEPAELRRLKQFCRELSLNGETPAFFVELNAMDEKSRPGEIVSLHALGPIFEDDPGAAAAWWSQRGGDIGTLNFVAGFLTGVSETD